MASGRDLTSALALLMSNAQLRRDFHIDPALVAEQLNLDAATQSIFLKLQPDQLERQARCLISKRCHEVRQIIPQTWANLGPNEAQRLFHDFADTFWPAGHTRHWQDAVAFCEFLRKSKISGVGHAEWNWLRFCLSRSRLRLHFVRDFMVGNRRRYGIQLLFRRSKQPRWFVLALPLLSR